MGGICRYSWRWIRYRVTLSALYDIRDDLKYEVSTSKGIEEIKIQEFYSRLKSNIQETREEWMSKRALSISGVIAKGDNK
jgi:hypothetical protein